MFSMRTASFALALVGIAGSVSTVVGQVPAGAPRGTAGPPPLPPNIVYHAPRGPLEAEPGASWKAAVVVSNRSAAPLRLTPRAQLPRGWRPLIPLDAFEVPPGTTNLVVLTAVVPQGTAAATYRIPIELESHRGEIRRDTLAVTVPPLRAIRIYGGAGPRFARLDTTITVDFVVRNDGNVPMTVALRARAVEAGAMVRDSAVLAMSAGDVRYVAVLVGPARTGGDHLVELEARAVGSTGTYSGSFEVLRVADAPSTRAVLPVELRLRATQGEVTPAQISVGVAGRRDTFDLIVRRPGEIGSQFGEREEYRARWSGRRGRILVGDIVPSEGPIRESYEMLMGYNVALRLGRFTASTYSGQDRLFGTETVERGASLSARAYRSLILGIGALQRTGPDSGEGRVWRAFSSFGGHGQSSPLLRGEVNGGTEGVNAYGIRAQRRFSRAWFDVSAADVATTSPSRERGSTRASAGIGARLTKHLSWRAWGGRYEMDTLPTRPFAFSSNSYAAGFTLGPLSTEYRHDEREAFVEGTAYSTLEKSARITLGHSLRGTVLTAGAEMGRSFDIESDSSTPYQRFTGAAYFNSRGRLSSGISAEYYSRKGVARNQQLSGSINASAQLLRRTRFEVHGSVFHVMFPIATSYSTINARLEQTLGRGQSIALRARAFTTTSATTLPQPATFFLEYGLPISIPLPGLGERQVRARVLEAANGRAVTGALVRMGEYVAITNADGRVSFAPTARVEELSVERPLASLPLVVDAPELASAREGRTRDVTIWVGEGSRVTGRVTRYDRVTRDSLAASGGIARVIVTATRGDDTTHVVTEDDGEFDFRQLPPGRWTITVSGGRLPSAYRFERSSATVVVEDGRVATLEFRVISRAAEATLDDGGSLSLPTLSPTPPAPKPAGGERRRPPR